MPQPLAEKKDRAPWERRAPGPVPRVLLAEDQPQMRAMIARVLRREGFEVMESEDGPALLQALLEGLTAEGEQRSPDLIITDVRMPGCSGLEVLTRLRRNDRDTPVLLITAFSDAELRAEAERLGATVLDKPFELETLRDMAHALLPEVN